MLLIVYARGVKGPDVPDRVLLLQTAFAGVLVHLFASPWTFWLGWQLANEGVSREVGPIILWVFGVFFVLPIAGGAALSSASDFADRIQPRWLRRVLARIGISTSVRTSTPWTMAWRTLSKEVLVRIQRKDGSKVLGRFGEGRWPRLIRRSETCSSRNCGGLTKMAGSLKSTREPWECGFKAATSTFSWSTASSENARSRLHTHALGQMPSIDRTTRGTDESTFHW